MNTRKKIPAKLAGYLLLFILTYAILLGLYLISVRCIPRERVLPNLKRSAEFVKDKDPLERDLEGILASRRDYVSDPYLLNILYYQDAEHPARSVARAAFYHEEKGLPTTSFYKVVTDQPEPNTEYLRYWHGSTAIVRVLLLFMDLPGIYHLQAILLAAVFVLLSVILLRGRELGIWICLCVSLAAGSLWFCAGAIEYIWSALLMLLFSMLAYFLCKKEKERFLPAVFLVSGMLINFLDFLTFETVTLTVPVLLGCALLLKKGKDIKETVFLSVESAVLWVIGYGCMWAGKWVYASAVLHENVMPYVTGHIEERLVGEAPLPSNYLLGTIVLIKREFAELFPFGYGKGGLAIGLIGLFIFACVCYVFRKKKVDKKILLFFFLWSLLPIIRFLVLRNHTAAHITYTYRALMGTVFAWALMAAEWNDFSLSGK